MPFHRNTYVVHSKLAMDEIRLQAARSRGHGTQVMSFEQLAVRLAGGFTRAVDGDSLRAAIQEVLPITDLGELDSIKSLPGMVDASVDTLNKAWVAGLDLSSRASAHPRLLSIARLEAAVLARLPVSMKRPADLAQLALARLAFGPVLFGSIDILGITELSPCWRPLLQALAVHVPVRWIAGPRSVPAWLVDSAVDVVRSEPRSPIVIALSASTAYHEAIEAVRWARALLASGTATPADIAIASVAPTEYDDHLLAIRSDANLDIHFVHGVKVTASREGQAAAALADVLLRGLSQTRIRRLAALLGREKGLFGSLPTGWTRLLPRDAPLASVQAWNRLVDGLTAVIWPDQQDHSQALRDIIALIGRGIRAAAEVGEQLLGGRALAIWRKALLAAPSASLEATLETLKQEDSSEACMSVAWMPASALAASPRRFVRLLGLNSSRWPRGIAEDRLLSDHIIPMAELDPLPVGAADRRDFETILVTTECQIVLSRARRDSEGRLLGRSALLQGHDKELYVARDSVPVHAMSETDRLLARPAEFAQLPQARSASTCWTNWRRPELTPHDGLVRSDHPVILAILDRPQSASSLRRLLRHPLGFVWSYGMGWNAPEGSADPLVLGGSELGELVHRTLDSALRALETNGGLAAAGDGQIADAIKAAITEAAAAWESERAVPPLIIWQRTMTDVCQLATSALTSGRAPVPGSKCYSEVPFGGAGKKSEQAPAPWDLTRIVVIPKAGFRISGYIDRLDVSADGRTASVRDYKTGRPPKDIVILDKGRELQRCLYSFAVRALLGAETAISASLQYLRNETEMRLDDPEAAMNDICTYLQHARDSLRRGNSLVGPDAGDDYDELAFALPANAKNGYCQRKQLAIGGQLGDAALIWEAK